MGLAHPARHIDQYMVALRHESVEVDAEQGGRARQLQMALFAQLARQGVERRLPDLHASARQMPARQIGMAHKEHPPRLVQRHRPHAHGERTRQAEPQMRPALEQAKQRAGKMGEHATNPCVLGKAGHGDASPG